MSFNSTLLQSNSCKSVEYKMYLLLILSIIALLVAQTSVINAKIVNLKIWGTKYWVDVPFLKDKQIDLLEREYCDLSDEEKLNYVNKVVGLKPSEGRRHVWNMGKKWLKSQLTESKQSLLDDISEITDAKIPSDRALAVVHFALNHRVVTATGVAGLYYVSKLFFGPSPSERAMAKVREYQEKLNRGSKFIIVNVMKTYQSKRLYAVDLLHMNSRVYCLHPRCQNLQPAPNSVSDV